MHLFSERFDSFKDYNGTNDIIQLSLMGFCHLKNNIIKCVHCNRKFLCFNPYSDHWIKHKKSMCQVINQQYLINDDIEEKYNDCEFWLNLKYCKTLIESKKCNFSDLECFVKEFINYNINYENIIMFREFINFKLNY